jgi:hypothetical protein
MSFLAYFLFKYRDFLLQALILHYTSYNSTMKFILSVDDEIFPDYCQLLDDVSESLKQMKDAASTLSKSIKKF